MILVIIINSELKPCYPADVRQRMGRIIAQVIIVGLAFIGLSADALKLLIIKDCYCLR